MDRNSGETPPAAAPGPEPGASAETSKPKPEASAGASAASRDENGRFKKGESGNKRGRPPGIPNVNDELVRAVKKYRIGDKSWLQALLTRALQDPQLAKVVLDKIAIDATPATPAVSIRNNNSNQFNHQEGHVEIGKHLGDESVRTLLAELTQRLGDRGAFAGANGHDRQ